MLKNNLQFTIITCTLNSEEFLSDCLESVKAQGFQSLEHLFIDGYSSDRTSNLLNKYKSGVSYPVKVFRQKPKGISSAMNLGIEKARGEYLLFLHSDDQLAGKAVLDRVKKFINAHKDIDWMYGQIEEVDEGGEKNGLFPRYKIFQLASPLLLKIINFVPHQAVFMRRRVFKNFGNFNTNYKYCMDYDLWLRIAKRTHWIYIPTVISKYRIHEDSISSSTKNSLETKKEYQKIQDKDLNGLLLRIIKLINFTVEVKRKNYFFKLKQLLPLIDEYLFKYRRSYSLEGEDILAEYYLGDKSRGFYVDVGAGHPILFSNTYRFYKKGWDGINIDATPGSMKVFRKIRPRDINLELAIADVERELTLYLFKKPALNTMNEHLAELYKKMGNKIIKTVNLKTHTLGTVLDKYLHKQTKIDLMNVDTEGFDLRVLKSNNWSKYRPRYIVIETTMSGSQNVQQAFESSASIFLSKKGYSLISKLNNSLIFKNIK